MHSEEEVNVSGMRSIVERLTRTHVIGTTTAERLRYMTFSRKTEVSQEKLTILGKKHVLGLEVTMENAIPMTVVDCINKLNEGLLDEAVVVDKYARFGYGGEQVTSFAKIEDNKDKRIVIEYAMESDYIWVIADLGMMRKLAALVFLLTGPSLRYEQTFYSEVRGCMGRRRHVQSAVDFSVGAST